MALASCEHGMEELKPDGARENITVPAATAGVGHIL